MTTKPVTLASLLLGSSLVVGCTGTSGPAKLPGLSFTPQLEQRQDVLACGDDLDWSGDGSVDAQYSYAYDSAGFLTHATGVFAAGGNNDNLDYSYDANGNFTHLVEGTGAGGFAYEVTATYDGANLATYSQTYDGPDGHDGWTYSLSEYAGDLPGREDIAEDGGATQSWALAYDADGRLVSATSDQGDVETWTYDDAAGTITVDEDNGAFTGTITYGDDLRELSEEWSGSSPAAVASRTTYAYDGDNLASVTFESGTQDAPTVLQTLEVDTLRYDCASARSAMRAPSFKHPQGKLAAMTRGRR